MDAAGSARELVREQAPDARGMDSGRSASLAKQGNKDSSRKRKGNKAQEGSAISIKG